MLSCDAYLLSSVFFGVKKFKETLRNMKTIIRQAK